MGVCLGVSAALELLGTGLQTAGFVVGHQNAMLLQCCIDVSIVGVLPVGLLAQQAWWHMAALPWLWLSSTWI